LLIVHKKAVEAYRLGDNVSISLEKGEIIIGDKRFVFEPLPDKLREIIDRKGLVNYMKSAG
jgi:3-isopropylmalate dehydratase small subunit